MTSTRPEPDITTPAPDTTNGHPDPAITLYTWPTPNGQKIQIALAEMGLPYRCVGVNISAGDQFAPDFLAISPNNKIPALTDREGPDGQPVSLFESGAILVYLAEKTGQFFGQNARERYTILQWLMFQMGGAGPMLGQAHHFRIYAPEPINYAIDRYTNEAKRLYRVIDTRLANSAFIAGDNYTIADMALWPWLFYSKNQGIDWNEYPHAKAWFDRIGARETVRKAMKVLAEQRQSHTDPAAREILFGKRQQAQS